MVDFAFWAINSEGHEAPLNFGTNLKYKIKNIVFYSCGYDINGGLTTEDDFKKILEGIKSCSLATSMKRIGVLEIGVEWDRWGELMEEYDLTHIMLTKDY